MINYDTDQTKLPRDQCFPYSSVLLNGIGVQERSDTCSRLDGNDTEPTPPAVTWLLKRDSLAKYLPIDTNMVELLMCLLTMVYLI